MKKMILPLIAIIMIFSVVSCTQPEGDPFVVFSGEVKAEMRLNFGEGECEIAYDKGRKSIAFLQPDELSGYELRLDNGKPYMAFKETGFFVSDHAGIMVFLCENIFSAKADDITKISAEKSENGTLTIVKTENVIYEFSDKGEPIFISGTFDGVPFEITVLSFAGAI